MFVDTYGTGSIPDEEILAKVKAAMDFRPGPVGRDLDLKRSTSKTSGKNNRYQQTAAYGTSAATTTTSSPGRSPSLSKRRRRARRRARLRGGRRPSSWRRTYSRIGRY